MAGSIHLSQKRKLRSHPQKAEEESLAILSARYVHDFSIALTFNTGEMRLVDFLPLFQKSVKGENLKYFAPDRFKKFIVKSGNIYWGRNEDVIFPTSLLYYGAEDDKDSDTPLYVI